MEGVYCGACRVAFGVTDGVFVLLGVNARNPRLEIPLLEVLADKAGDAAAREACGRTISMLRSARVQSHAWEDEEHWSREYASELASGAPKNWNDRLWQREPLFRLARRALGEADPAKPRTVIDIGCGEGQDFRTFLARDLRPNDSYIALDISLPGLLLNRARNPHPHAVFVLGSADAAPLRRGTAAVVICLGVIHHMEAKASGLPLVAGLLDRGALLLSDPINGHYLPPSLRLRRSGRSAHDGTLDYRLLRGEIERNGLEVAYERQLSGIVYLALLRLFRPLLLSRRWLHTWAHRLDEAVSRLLGPAFRLFRPRSVLLVLWRR
jgi:SAM-dependent methyltransferase